jgi:hypothetical protein
VETAAKCPNGVARVETRLSFLNQLVSGLTLGIYTPMEIVVTCAERSSSSLDSGTESDLHVRLDASDQEVLQVFALAAEKAVRSKKPVYVHFADEPGLGD